MHIFITAAALLPLCPLTLAAPLHVSSPTNDECGTATSVSLGTTVFDTTAATTSSEASSCTVSFGKDVWFSYTATSDADVTIDTCGSTFDTVLEIFTGSCGALSWVTCNDDSCSTQSSISLTGFTPGLTILIRVGGFSGATGAGSLTLTSLAPPTGFYISEYVEGSQNNKAIEIYNGTAEAIDLSGYQLRCYLNGNALPNYTSTLSGTLAPYETAVYVPTSGNTGSVVADLNARGIPFSTATAINFNGDDCIALTTVAGDFLDVIGRVGFDPGTRWGSGSTTTQNDTLRRKPLILTGDSDPSDPFDPSVEWDGFPQNTFDGLGEHFAGADCNSNGAPDSLDIANGTSQDCNSNGIPDECEVVGGQSDCNGNGVPDLCDIASGAESDCNLNEIPDSCELASDPTLDLNSNGALDACESIGTRYCSPAVANSTGASSEIVVLGSVFLGDDDVTLAARQLPQSSFGFFITSQTPASINSVANSMGTLCVTGAVGRYVGPGQLVNSGSTGTVALPIDLGAMPTPTGLVAATLFSTWHFQLWHRDGVNGQSTSNFTDAVAVTFQ